VKRIALVLLVGAAVAAGFAAPAGATNECRGFQVCAPVAGPWVVVPTATTFPRPSAKWVLTCPKGFVVGGLDAELTDRWIDVSFEALIGSPVNPGITTKRSVLFTATSVAGPPRTASFRPHIGCLPASGGGSGIPTVAHVVPPGHPAVRRVWTVRVQPGAQVVRRSCLAGETLVNASHAVGFYGKTPPGTRLVKSVHATRTVHDRHVSVSVRAGAAVANVRAVVQLDLTCAGGGT
jgi:hypothetical protein